jgi:5'-deoxynucleotidase YfbR-like HD superfamily hydrolase
MDQSFKTLRSALHKQDTKALNKALKALASPEHPLKEILTGYYEHLIDEGDIDGLRDFFSCYTKAPCKDFVAFMDKYEDFDYPLHEEGKKGAILLQEKVIKSVPDKLTWFYGYVFNTDSKYKKKLAEALKKRYKDAFPAVLKKEATGEEMSDKDFLDFLERMS